MIKGALVYLAGVIGKLAPDSIKLESPVGIIAIRSTPFTAKLPERLKFKKLKIRDAGLLY